ncbi:MAG: hypothetical protein QXR97_00015 [Thermoproteota archaeon]
MVEAKLSKLYELYARIYGNKNIVDREISKLIKEGLSREEAINKLYERDIGEKEPTTKPRNNRYDGKFWGIYYLPINSFEEEMPKLGETLDYIEENHGEVVAVIPNIGITPTSLILGTSFQGVKGFSIVYRKRKP